MRINKVKFTSILGGGRPGKISQPSLEKGALPVKDPVEYKSTCIATSLMLQCH